MSQVINLMNLNNKSTRFRLYLIFILVVLFLSIRLPILCNSIYHVLYMEEIGRGTIAMELMKGPSSPLFEYYYDPYAGGSILVSILAIPFFLLFGPSFASLKFVGLSFFTATLILWYLFCNRFFNRRVAVIMSLLFILSPPTFTKFSLVTMGFHSESILFSILAILVFYEIFFNKKQDKEYFILFGLISGFGLWFSYSFISTLLTLLLFWFLFDKRFFLKKDFLIFIVFFSLGFSPWIYYNITYNFVGLGIVKQGFFVEPFNIDRIIQFADRLKKLIFLRIPNSLIFSDINLKREYLVSKVYCFILAVSFCSLLWWNRRYISNLLMMLIPWRRVKITPMVTPKEFPLIIYFIIFSFIYSLSNFECGLSPRGLAEYRHIIPLFPFAFFLISLFLDRMKKIYKPIFFILMAFLILIGLFYNLRLITFDSDFGKGFNIKGYLIYNVKEK